MELAVCVSSAANRTKKLTIGNNRQPRLFYQQTTVFSKTGAMEEL
jgi:hypothetical protein